MLIVHTGEKQAFSSVSQPVSISQSVSRLRLSFSKKNNVLTLPGEVGLLQGKRLLQALRGCHMGLGDCDIKMNSMFSLKSDVF